MVHVCKKSVTLSTISKKDSVEYKASILIQGQKAVLSELTSSFSLYLLQLPSLKHQEGAYLGSLRVSLMA